MNHALNVPENPEFEKDPRVAATRRFVAKVYHYEDFRAFLDEALAGDDIIVKMPEVP